MYAYLRLLRMFFVHAFRRKQVINPLEEQTWRVRPGIWDIDVYPEVNNGRHFVLFDLARYDLALKIGLFRWVRKKKAAFVVGGSSIRYRHRLRPWRKMEVKTKLVGMDERFFYFQQRTVQSGRTCSSALLRTGVRKNGAILTSKVLDGIGLEIEPFMEPWVEQWNQWDEGRPS